MRARIVLGVAISLGIAAIAVGAAGSVRPGPQRDKSQRPSPPGHTECKFAGGTTITVDYSSPRMKGRKIYGDVVPYGQVWRAGANEATTFVASGRVHVGPAAGGIDVPAGNYTLFVIPNKDKPWTLIISKKTGEWGIPYPGEEDDLGRTEMGGSVLPSAVENFTIGLTHDAGDTFLLHMDWETTGASVKIVEKK
ncbi:MAG TPA: DUF2911 domain-containing protein [Candidatus Acidoferrales bacterium]|nr:DUF2911 domain-containing protein [Candidatus Acidoferrales bacterium]